MGKWTEAKYETEFISKVRSIFDEISDRKIKEGEKYVTFEEFVDKFDVNNKSTRIYFEEIIKETCGVSSSGMTHQHTSGLRRYREPYSYVPRENPRNFYFLPGSSQGMMDVPHYSPFLGNPNPNNLNGNHYSINPNNNSGNNNTSTAINHQQHFDQLNQQTQQVLQHVRSQMASSLSSSLNTNLPNNNNNSNQQQTATASLLIPFSMHSSSSSSGATTSSSNSQSSSTSSSTTSNNPLLPIPMPPFNSSSSSSSSSPSNSTSTPVSPSLQPFEFAPPRLLRLPITRNLHLNSSIINSPPSSPPTSNHNLPTTTSFFSSPYHNNL